MTPRIMQCLLVIVIPLLQAAFGFSESMPMDDGKELTYVIPDGWSHQRNGGNVEIRTSGINVKWTLMPVDNDSKPHTQESVEKLVLSTSKRCLKESVEKKATLVPMKGMIGSYACFTDASLVGKKDSPGKYKIVTTGVIGYGKSVVIFTLLSNSLDSKSYKAALSIITSLDYHAVAPGPVAYAVPGQKWKILFEAPQFYRVHSGPTEDGCGYMTASKNGFKITIFVNEMKGKKLGHKACADFYWPAFKKDTNIDQSTVVIENKKEFVKVSYRIKGEFRSGVKFDVPNIALFIEYEGMWINIHISKYPFKKEDQRILDGFVKSLKFEAPPKKEDDPKTADKKDEPDS